MVSRRGIPVAADAPNSAYDARFCGCAFLSLPLHIPVLMTTIAQTCCSLRLGAAQGLTEHVLNYMYQLKDAKITCYYCRIE